MKSQEKMFMKKRETNSYLGIGVNIFSQLCQQNKVDINMITNVI